MKTEQSNDFYRIDQDFIDLIKRNNLLRKNLMESLSAYLDGLKEEYTFILSVGKNDPDKQDSNVTSLSSKYPGYHRAKTVVDKIIYFLSCHQGKMSFQELKEAFLTAEPELKDKWANVNSSLSSNLYVAHSYGVITRSKAYGKHGSYYYELAKDL